MTPAALTIATALRRHPRFTPTKGMRFLIDGGPPVRVVDVSPYRAEHEDGRGSTPCTGLAAGDVPDLDDWPTAGALLGMLAAERTMVYAESRLGERAAQALLNAWGAP